MAKRYPRWLNNADAIDLRTHGEKYLDALEGYQKFRAVRDDLISAMKETSTKSIAAAYDNLEYAMWQYQREMVYRAHQMTGLLRIKVPRYIKDGVLVTADEPADE